MPTGTKRNLRVVNMGIFIKKKYCGGEYWLKKTHCFFGINELKVGPG